MTPLTRTLLLAAMVMVPLGPVRGDSEQYSRLPEAVRRVELDTGGKVLQVKMIQRGDREIYRMKVLTPDGRVKVVQDDPRRPLDGRDERAPPRLGDRRQDDPH